MSTSLVSQKSQNQKIAVKLTDKISAIKLLEPSKKPGIEALREPSTPNSRE